MALLELDDGTLDDSFFLGSVGQYDLSGLAFPAGGDGSHAYPRSFVRGVFPGPSGSWIVLGQSGSATQQAGFVALVTAAGAVDTVLQPATSGRTIVDTHVAHERRRPARDGDGAHRRRLRRLGPAAPRRADAVDTQFGDAGRAQFRYRPAATACAPAAVPSRDFGNVSTWGEAVVLVANTERDCGTALERPLLAARIFADGRVLFRDGYE